MSTAKYVAAVRSVSKRFMLVLALLAIVVGGFAAGAAAAGVQNQLTWALIRLPLMQVIYTAWAAMTMYIAMTKQLVFGRMCMSNQRSPATCLQAKQGHRQTA